MRVHGNCNAAEALSPRVGSWALNSFPPTTTTHHVSTVTQFPVHTASPAAMVLLKNNQKSYPRQLSAPRDCRRLIFKRLAACDPACSLILRSDLPRPFLVFLLMRCSSKANLHSFNRFQNLRPRKRTCLGCQSAIRTPT